MSDDLVGRYRRVYPRIFRQPGFQKLKRASQVIALYALAGPQTNRIGLFHFSIATAAEDLGLGVDTFREGLRDVAVTFGWAFDADARVLYIPSWWRFNCPENVNVLKGNLKDLSEIPPCGLIEAFATNTAYLPLDLIETFTETLRKRLPKRSPTQEQEQESRKTRSGKQEPSALRASRKKEGNEGGLLPIAREVLKLTNPNAGLEHLYDAFRQMHQDTKTSKADIIAAINDALSERRASA